MTTPEATLQPALDSELAQTAAPALPMWQGWLPWLAAALATTVLFYALRVYVIVALEAVLLMMNGTYRKGQKRKAYSRGNYRPQLQEMDPTECKVSM